LQDLAYLSPMKNIIILSSLLISISLNGQLIDFHHFDKRTMNEVMFNQMSDYIMSHYGYSIINYSLGQHRIYQYIKKNSLKMSPSDMCIKINNRILRKYDSKIVSKTKMLGCVGFINSISIENCRTYQDISENCLLDWVNSENGVFMNWSQVGHAVSYYNKTTRTVYVFWAFLI
jgi:hypothetical protein